MVDMKIPDWASMVIVRKDKKDNWSVSILCTEHDGYESRSADGTSVQEAIDATEKQFDFDSNYWKAKRGEPIL